MLGQFHELQRLQDDILKKLLHLNLALAEKEKNGENIVGPWAIDNPPTAN
ncbi:DNA modification methyltransferase [[Synechococcus] sp. NIES-970]|nr:DNA modification methyltransferase [[Synechococcus] sp. NIES-970]